MAVRGIVPYVFLKRLLTNIIVVIATQLSLYLVFEFVEIHTIFFQTLIIANMGIGIQYVL